MLSVNVYRGTSVNEHNAAGAGLATCGRFSAVIDSATVRVAQAETGEWYYTFPKFCSCGHYESEAEASAQALAWIAHNRDGWTTDRDVAVRAAIAHARARHEEHAARSPTYRARYGN